MNRQHTPGPWASQGAMIRDGNMALIGMATEHFGDESTPAQTIYANAQLMAMAPQLLDALYRLIHPMADESDVEHAMDLIDRATCPVDVSDADKYSNEGANNG